jgi:hypothetical protein
MTVTPQVPTPDPYEEPGTEVPESEPGDVPQGPQETNPDADDEPQVPLDSGPDSEAGLETSNDVAPGQMPASTNTEVGA